MWRASEVAWHIVPAVSVSCCVYGDLLHKQIKQAEIKNLFFSRSTRIASSDFTFPTFDRDMGTRNILHVSEIYLKENSKMSVMINGTGDSASVSGDIRAWWGLRQNWALALSARGPPLLRPMVVIQVVIQTFCHQIRRLGRWSQNSKMIYEIS